MRKAEVGIFIRKNFLWNSNEAFYNFQELFIVSKGSLIYLLPKVQKNRRGRNFKYLSKTRKHIIHCLENAALHWNCRNYFWTQLICNQTLFEFSRYKCGHVFFQFVNISWRRFSLVKKKVFFPVTILFHNLRLFFSDYDRWLFLRNF